MKTAVFPGSFDPVTLGHLDIIERSATVFDKVYVSVLNNGAKSPTFSLEERVSFLQRVTKHLENVEIDTFSGLLADYVSEKKIDVIVKGIRSASDFDYEFQMALINKTLNPKVETVFLPTNPEYMAVHSSYVKEIAAYGGAIESMVSPEIISDIYRKIQRK